MRRLTFALLVCPLLACTDSGLPTDGGTDAERCAMLAGAINGWLSAHQSCATDDDCTSVTTACGLPTACGTFVNKSGMAGDLTQLVSQWNASCKPAQPCNCPAWFPEPGCNAGACGWRMASRPVGESCASGADCKTAECVTAKETIGFVGGYCTIRDCMLKNIACPTGSTCKDFNNTSYCLKDCKPGGTGECRDGYRCCWGPGPSGQTGWCAPVDHFLCTAK